MQLKNGWRRLQGYYQRKAASILFKSPMAIGAKGPVISFTFDDFPESALRVGGAILSHYGFTATYYVSLGLLGQNGPTGHICDVNDLILLLEQGHELGCHTFDHHHSWETDTIAYERSVSDNRAALRQIIPDAMFNTFSYPISPPRPMTKSRIAKHFQCCRSGGQTLNVGTVDLNQLSAFFLEKSRDNLNVVKDMIDRNSQLGGWLIFATHDVSEEPTPYGCTPEFFENVVCYVNSSGARVLPVVQAMTMLRGSRPGGKS